MTRTTIGIDPHKNSHTATAIGASREDLATIKVRSSKTTTRQLLAWADRWPDRIWAIEGASGLGHLVAQQLVAHGETVFDVPALLLCVVDDSPEPPALPRIAVRADLSARGAVLHPLTHTAGAMVTNLLR